MSTTAHIYFSFNTYVYDLMPASDIDARGHRLRRTISAPNKGTDTQSGFSQVRFLGGEGEGEGGSIKQKEQSTRSEDTNAMIMTTTTL